MIKQPIRSIILWFALLLLMSGCATQQPSIEVATEQELRQWQAPLNREAIGLGNIWSYKRQQWIETDQLQAEIQQSDYLMMGEKHDNPDHHRIQWFLLSHLQQQGRLASLTMEMLRQSQQAQIDEAYHLSAMSLDLLTQHLDWSAAENRGWKWDYYGPQMLLAIEAGIPLRAGNLDRQTIRDIYTRPASYPELLEGSKQQSVRAALQQQIRASHCGMIESQHLQAMVQIQQHRDKSMAEVMMPQAAQSGVAVLVAGAHHVRRDVGVPLYLLSEQPNARLVTVGMIELADEASGGVGDALTEFRGVYDYLWFTPKVSRPDYCANWQARGRKG